MKSILFLLCILSLASSYAANIDDCLLDAQSHGSHIHPITPSSSCADLIKSHPRKVELSSKDGKYKVYGLDHMVYVEAYQDGSLMTRELLAGDQTRLKEVQKFSINSSKNRLLILQEGAKGTELLVYQLNFIGNVAPVKFLDAEVVQGATSALLVDKTDELRLSFKSEGKARHFGSEADSRYKDQHAKYNPAVIREEALAP